MKKWRFLPYKKYQGAYNMAIDEAIMEAMREKTVEPTIRFYGWMPTTLSIGYFQRVEEEIDLQQLKRQQIDLVRRMTGGRAVLHDQELTYSIIMPENYPGLPHTISESYRILSTGLLLGYKKLGIDAELAKPSRKKEPILSAACFDQPSDYELIVGGKKMAGSAQLRQRGVVLQHGSILVHFNKDKLRSLLKHRNDQQLKVHFANHASAINERCDHPRSFQEIQHAFHQGFSEALQDELSREELTLKEKKRVEALAREKYTMDTWNFKR
ncbi:lipoate--protein ligase family protein [Hazenella sp. IB182357]|uniref:Lipoate--protein ligase family protein n=1 Tax=Polycladospora coralii TaxID=2771432 RepID=A0A926RTT9_9BACL|nr:biotin/lipoate A/B protein ligase family protein [Polycladospora coralii]MBD1373200.1 lipoate--protein ligase family protein [Polycladospora coralii]MBS7530858.1 lipoate--protein ligase family protein [Polycladospora coralii]